MKTITPFHVCLLFALAIPALGPLSAFAQWSDGRPANAVIGQSDYTSNDAGVSISSLDSPADVAVHHESGKVFVSDRGNHRVLRFSSVAAMSEGAAAEMVFGQSSFSSFNPDNSQTGLYDPHGIFVDDDGNLWVAEYTNSRVVCFEDAVDTTVMGKAASLVLGQPDYTTIDPGTTDRKMRSPLYVTVDANGNLWVADTGNNRVLQFLDAKTKQNGDPADKVLGQSTFMTGTSDLSMNRMNQPGGLATRTKFYQTGSFPPIILGIELWVSDYANNRVLRFDHAGGKTDGGDADGVLGQQGFMTDAADSTPEAMYLPLGLAVNGAGDLWLADNSNHRVLLFERADQKQDGGPADFVVGQVDLDSDDKALTRTGMGFPTGVAIDADGNLFVASRADNRVVRFSPAQPARPDNLVGAKSARNKQKGNNRYNATAAGQKIRIRKDRRAIKVHFTCQNDGGTDLFRFRATKGNKKVKVKYFSFAGGTRSNVTGQITSGNYRTNVVGGSSFRILAKVRAKERATRKLSLQTTALGNGAVDKVLAKLIFQL